jgi:hypothetical protein
MKTRTGIVLLILFNLTIDGQDLRIFGTNLYDFSPVSSGQKLSRYTIAGKIVGATPYSVTIRPPFCFRLSASSDRAFGGPEDMLAFMGAVKLSEAGSGTISSGHYFALSPEMRRNFSKYQPPDIVVTNCTLGRESRGEEAQLCALPTEDPSVWNYGTPVDVTTATNFAKVFRVYSKTIAEESATQRPLTMLTPFQRRTARAQRGVAHDQWDLGMDYWIGLGVETNADLAVYWIRKAAAQSYPEAIEFLKTNAPPGL